MNALKFEIGDVLADKQGTIGTVIGLQPESQFPYRVLEIGGGTASYAGHEDVKVIGRDEPADPVSHPSHYTGHPSGIECIQITEHMGFNLGNALKYIWRCDLKHDAIEDLKKAAWYIGREIEKREESA
jgi:hypothetical protein